jgi:hypothetical protein
MQSFVAIRQQLRSLDYSREGPIDADCRDSFGIDPIERELLIFSEVLHVGLIEAEFACILLFEGHARGHQFGGPRHLRLFHLNFYNFKY